MSTQPDNAATVRAFVDAFNAADLPAMAACLADGLVAEVTQKDGSTRQVAGGDAYMDVLLSLKFGQAGRKTQLKNKCCCRPLAPY